MISFTSNLWKLTSLPWRFRTQEHYDRNDDRKNELDADRSTPGRRTVNIGEPEINPVGADNADSNEPNFPGDQSAAVLFLGQFGLIHGNRRGVDASSKTWQIRSAMSNECKGESSKLLTSDDAAHDQMGQRERRRLQSCSHNDQSHGHPNHTTASEYVADGKIDPASCESA
jgi:hypothetical protein